MTFTRLVDESPRWLFSQGRLDEAGAVVSKQLSANGKDGFIPRQGRSFTREELAAALSTTTTTADDPKQAEDDDKAVVNYGIVHLFKTPRLRYRTFNISLNWYFSFFWSSFRHSWPINRERGIWSWRPCLIIIMRHSFESTKHFNRRIPLFIFIIRHDIIGTFQNAGHHGAFSIYWEKKVERNGGTLHLNQFIHCLICFSFFFTFSPSWPRKPRSIIFGEGKLAIMT